MFIIDDMTGALLRALEEARKQENELEEDQVFKPFVLTMTCTDTIQSFLCYAIVLHLTIKITYLIN